MTDRPSASASAADPLLTGYLADSARRHARFVATTRRAGRYVIVRHAGNRRRTWTRATQRGAVRAAWSAYARTVYLPCTIHVVDCGTRGQPPKPPVVLAIGEGAVLRGPWADCARTAC